MATASELDDLMKDMGVDETEKPQRRDKRRKHSRRTKEESSGKSRSSKREKGKSSSKARSERRSHRRRSLHSDEDVDVEEEERAPARRERRKHGSSRSSKSKKSSSRSKHVPKISDESEEENDFDKPEPLPEDPANASTDDINKIRDHISKKLRNQDDDEPYTFRELRKEISKELQQPLDSKPWRRWFNATAKEINEAIEAENSDWDDEGDSDDVPVGSKAAWSSSSGHGTRYAHGNPHASARSPHGRLADSDVTNEKKLQNILGRSGSVGASASAGVSFAERLKLETQSLAKRGAGGGSLISQLRATRTPGQKAGHSSVFGLHIGGVQVRRACRELRCMKCDFDVVCVQGYRWDESCNYIFFRNYVPDMKKLRPRLVRDRFMCAYACQCTWQSVRAAKSLQGSRVRAEPEGGAGSGGDVRWVQR